MNKIYFRYIFFIFTLLSVHTLYSQQPYHYNLNDENGLPSNEVYQVIQDDFGYIWIGCDAGLFRYDGFEYKQYKSSNQNGRSISGLQLDKKGKIWCRNFNGQVYRVKEDSLQLISDFNQNTSSNNFVIDNECNAWIVCKNKLIKFSENGKKLMSTKIPNSRGDNSFIADIIFFQNNLYISQLDFGIYSFSKKRILFEQLKNQEKIIKSKTGFYISNNQLYLLSENPKDKRYLVSRISRKSIHPIKSFFTNDENVLMYKIVNFHQNETWICTSKGALQDKFIPQNLDQIQCGLLANKKISHCLKDKEGMYWFCTLNDGIYIFPSLAIQKYDPTNSIFPNKNVSAIGKDNHNSLLIGLTSGEVVRLNAKNNHVQKLDITSKVKLITTKKIIHYKGISYVAHGQLTEVIKNNYKALPFYHLRDFMIFQDTLYAVSSEFTIKIGMKDVKAGDQSKIIYIQKSGGRNIAVDSSNNKIYFVLNDGIYCYSQNKLTPLLYQHKSIFASSITFKDNTLWIASISSGLLTFKNNSFQKRYGITNGLKENEIKFLTSSNKYIWACGNNYLYRISINNGEVAHYNKSNGINASEIKTIEIFKEKVYLGTNKGLIVFAENFKWKNKITPKIEVKSIEEGEKSISFRNGLFLNYDHKNIIIHLSSISFKSKSRFYYLYRIKGLNNEWIKIPVQNKRIILSTILPGNYTLEIKSINDSDIESKVISIPIFVDAPIWQKGWFSLLLIIISISIITLIFYIRIKLIKRKSELHSKLVSSQLTALKAQMNPHFMFNALNSIQDLVLEKDIKNSNLYLSKFSKLMRKILDASGFEKIALQDEIEILHLYLDLEKLRFGDDFTFSISYDRSIDPYDAKIPSMILQPFVENAIKHGLLHKKGPKELSIDFQLNEFIICTIKDNGVGRKHATEIKERRKENHRSFATSATEKRIELLNEYDQENYSFEIIDLEENGESKGTLVKIKFPY